MITSTTRISISEAAVLTGRRATTVEKAMQQGDLRYVLSGADRRIRTTPEWVGGWVAGRGR